MNRRKPSTSSRIKEFISEAPIVKHIFLAVCIFLIAIIVVNILLRIFTRHSQVYEVPDFSGMSIEQALQAGSEANLRITINDSLYVADMPAGVILEQNPAHGAMVKSNRHIFVITNSFAQQMVDIPYVTGYSLRQAKNNLEVAGLSIDKLIYTDDIATNNVISQKYGNTIIEDDSKKQAPKGAGITLVVGRQSADIQQQIPMVVGLTLSQAKSRLWESGFNIGRINYDQDITDGNAATATVISQTPYAGNLEELGDQISLRISFDQDKIASGVKDANAEYKRIEEERSALLEFNALDSLELENLENPLQYNE